MMAKHTLNQRKGEEREEKNDKINNNVNKKDYIRWMNERRWIKIEERETNETKEKKKKKSPRTHKWSLLW